MLRRIRSFYYSGLRKIGNRVLSWNVADKSFTIFSNDCFGGEIYQRLNIPYNTPFVGLMLMAPCYIKFLESPQFYLTKELNFTESSKYDEMNDLRTRQPKYPIGIIDDIEIHFLHYHNEIDAKEKWDKRKRRINWNNLLVKFAMDKDYATAELLSRFSELPFSEKISFSKLSYPQSKTNIVVPEYNLNASVTFRYSLKVFNLCGWLNGEGIRFRSIYQRVVGLLLYFTFQR